MDMNSVRCKNLRAIIGGWKDGKPAQFSRDTGIDESRLSQVLSETYRNGNNFGEKAARAIEKRAGLPPFALDKIEFDSESDSARLSGVAEQKQGFDKNVTPAMTGKRAIPVISLIQAGAVKEITDPYEAGDGYAVLYTDED